MSTQDKNQELHSKNPSESVNSFLSKKSSEISSSVNEKMSGTQNEVADVIGIDSEKVKENISERNGESGQKGDLKSSSQKSDDDLLNYALEDYKFPKDEILIKKIRFAIESQIKVELKKAKKLKSNLHLGNASEYNESIAKIRKLRQVLQSLLSGTMDFVKNLYVKYFKPNGRRK